MQFIEADPLPMVCQTCEDRKNCLAQGEGEWCCDECDHLGKRFISILNCWSETINPQPLFSIFRWGGACG